MQGTAQYPSSPTDAQAKNPAVIFRGNCSGNECPPSMLIVPDDNALAGDGGLGSQFHHQGLFVPRVRVDWRYLR
jgi:hypothetical protein